uniref:Bcl-x interacting BH3 domain-containing protein n=1 Tax=Ficedula albicollis TaxID=59894 RepID=A0A803VLS8_FICAL
MFHKAAVPEVQPEVWIAQELRRIGDEFNASYCPRRVTRTFPSALPTPLRGKG